MATRKFKPTWESVKTHTVPTWYDDCKLGIFIHWGPYSVPAFAPPSCELGDIPLDEGWFCNNPYAEWYLNSIRTKKGPSYEYHINKYGETFDYENFTYMWKAEKWNPGEWAELFKKAGAGYVVLTTKHHDGFCLWPSRYTDFNTAKRGPERDLMGELTAAVRNAGLKMGAYYSGILDWSYTSEPILEDDDLRTLAPITNAYADYAYNQVTELIDRYKPSVLWNDIGWPVKGVEDLKHLFAHYYNTVEEGVVDDRWNDVWCDFTSKEYGLGDMNVEKKWEMCRGIGYSFGFNAMEDEKQILSSRGLVSLLVKTVSHNGNLLINIGPKADGTIPEIQKDRLLAMGAWLAENGEAIYGTRPYIRQYEKTTSGAEVFFTKKDNDLYIILDNLKAGNNEIAVGGITAAAGRASFLGGKKRGTFKDTAEGLAVTLENLKEQPLAVVVKLSGYIG